jgi:hypothetical protein
VIEMRAVVLTKSLAAANAAIIAASQTPVSGTALTLVGGGTVTLDTARRVIVTAGSEASPRTLVLTGTNGSGTPITETIAIPASSAGAVASVQDFLTVSQALPLGGGWTAAATVGTNGVGSTPWQLLNNHITEFMVGFQLTLKSGSAGFAIELTNESPMQTVPWDTVGGGSPTVSTPTAFSPTGFGSLSASANLTLTEPCLAWRLTINSGTGVVEAAAVQAGIRN